MTAWAIFSAIRLLKEDVRWLPTVKAGNRRLLAAALGLTAGTIDAVATGATWSSAFIAIGSPPLAIVAHHVVVDGALRGRDLPIPAWLRAPKVEPETVTRIVGGLIVFAVLLCSGCSTLRTVNDARNALCDLVGQDQQAELDAEAARVGMSPAEMLEVWRATCLVRIEAAERDAVGAIGGGR
jgi:hypothetical protein